MYFINFVKIQIYKNQIAKILIWYLAEARCLKYFLYVERSYITWVIKTKITTQYLILYQNVCGENVWGRILYYIIIHNDTWNAYYSCAFAFKNTINEINIYYKYYLTIHLYYYKYFTIYRITSKLRFIGPAVQTGF